MNMKRIGIVPAVLFALLLEMGLGSPAQGVTKTIALSGKAVPDGNGVFSGFGAPRLNASGQVVFLAFLTGTSGGSSDDEGIFLGDGGPVTQIAREGQAPPDGNGVFSDFSVTSFPALNASGQVAFLANLTGISSGSSYNWGIFLGDGGPVTQIARTDQAPPDGNGAFSDFSNPALNASGQAAFGASLTGTSGGSSDNQGIFLGDGGPVTQIARAGQTAPDGNGAFSNFIAVALNASGQAAFGADLTGTSGGSSDDQGIFLGDGGPVTQIARAGQAAPDGNGVFSDFGIDITALNASGQAAFWAELTGTSGGSSDNRGIFLGDGGPVTQIARAGQAAPDGNGAFSNFSAVALNVNASGQAAFTAFLTGTSGGSSDDEGIFLGDGGAVMQIARAGQTAPDGNGAFSNLSIRALNAFGQVAFIASLTGTSGGSSDNEGIFATNRSGELQVIARAGDLLEVAPGDFRAIEGLTVAERAFNNRGQLVFLADFTDGTSGVFVAIPEPASAALVVLALPLVYFRRFGSRMPSSARQASRSQ